MKPNFVFPSLVIVAAALAWPVFPAFAGMTLVPATDPASGVSVRIESWLESSPQCGMVPLRLSITNSDSRAHTWEISVHDGFGMGGTYVTNGALPVEAGHGAETTVYAMCEAMTTGSGYYRNLNINVSGPGIKVPYAGGLHSSHSGSSSVTPFIAMSKKLSAKGWSQLKAKLDSSHGSRSGTSDLDGSEVDMTQAPDDWRGYTCLAQLWMDESEWLSMGEGSKAALLDWLALGGHVFILASDISDARLDLIKLPPVAKGERRLGAGRVTALKWDGTTFPLDSVAKQIKDSGNRGIIDPLGNYESKWELRKAVGELGLQHGLIFGFIVVFGLLIGPVNLFLLAPAKRRQRLFWTTPLLSLAGSALLVALMIFQDGIGGHGTRITLAMLLPEQKKMALVQEQVSKTGVLLGRSFAKEEPAWMQPLTFKDNSGGYPYRREMQHHFNESPAGRSGDWFSSRAIQSQMIEAVRPTRAAIEFFPSADANAAPMVLSSIEVPLEKVFVIDEQQHVWVAENLGTGEKKALRIERKNEFSEWMQDQLKLTGAVSWGILEKGRKLPTGHVFAISSDASKIAVKTLDSIQWNNDRVIFTGPYVKH